MLATEYSPRDSVTTTVPIAIPAHIDSLSVDQVPEAHTQFVADNTSLKRIEAVIQKYFGTDGCEFWVYFFKRTPFRFFVTVTPRFGRITGSDFVSMFAEKEPEIVITPLAEVVISKDPKEIEPGQREGLRLIKNHSRRHVVEKVLYIGKSRSRSAVA